MARRQREKATERALAQRVAQTKVTSASNAAVTRKSIDAVADSVPPDLSDQLGEFNRRLTQLEDQP